MTQRKLLMMVVFLLLCICQAAQAKKKNKKYVDPRRPPDGSIELSLGTSVPVTKDGAAFVGKLDVEYQWNLYFQLHFSTQMATDPEDQVVPGNLVAGFRAGYFQPKKGWGYGIGLHMDMGLSPAELGDDKAWASNIGLYNEMSLASFMRNSLVLAPQLVLSLQLWDFGIQTWFGPEMGLPLYADETPTGIPYRGATAYGIKMGTGGGDLRGGIGFSVGFVGLADWTGEKEHTYCFDGGMGLRFTRPYFDFDFIVRIPVGGPSARIQTSILMILSWNYYPREED